LFTIAISMANRLSDRLVRLCTSNESVSSLLAQNPTLSPNEAWKKLYGDKALKAAEEELHQAVDGHEHARSEPATQEELEKAARCGKWGPTQPSELFLRVFHTL
jgi:hypothetical protein